MLRHVIPNNRYNILLHIMGEIPPRGDVSATTSGAGQLNFSRRTSVTTTRRPRTFFYFTANPQPHSPRCKSHLGGCLRRTCVRRGIRFLIRSNPNTQIPL